VTCDESSIEIVYENATKSKESHLTLSEDGVTVSQPYDDNTYEVLTVGNVDETTIRYNLNTHKLSALVPNLIANDGIEVIKNDDTVIRIGTRVDGTTVRYNAQGQLTTNGGSDSMFRVVSGITYDEFHIEHGPLPSTEGHYYMSFNDVPKMNANGNVFKYKFEFDMVDESGHYIKVLYSSENNGD
jgi:hypothetical protein